MKISDLQNYQISSSKEKKGNKTKTKLPAINAIGQKLIDATITITIRFVAFILSFKIAMKTI